MNTIAIPIVLTVAVLFQPPCPSVPDNFCEDRADQYYRHPTDCGCFIRCVNKKIYGPQECPGGTLFCQETQSFVHGNRTTCKLASWATCEVPPTVNITTRPPLKSCGDPGKPLNGYRTGHEFWVGNMVFYTCDSGYDLVGPSNRLCLENGAWSGSIPSCYMRYYSNILQNRTDYYKFMRVWLSPTTCMLTRWVPCYQSRLHGWASKTFHSNCDGKGPTITIIKVNKYIFGGYTDVSWHSKGTFSKSVNSFLFSFVNKDNLKPFKMKVFRSQYAIKGHSSYGPTFGDADIHIGNNAGSKTNSFTDLGHSYELIKGYTSGSTKTQNLLAGSYYFQPDEVEVFRQDGLDV